LGVVLFYLLPGLCSLVAFFKKFSKTESTGSQKNGKTQKHHLGGINIPLAQGLLERSVLDSGP
jgi:hypothetical protein